MTIKFNQSDVITSKAKEVWKVVSVSVDTWNNYLYKLESLGKGIYNKGDIEYVNSISATKYYLA
jgi:hypothetical protein